jgi:hypothetical protein
MSHVSEPKKIDTAVVFTDVTCPVGSGTDFLPGVKKHVGVTGCI